jgi:hypothetical protein
MLQIALKRGKRWILHVGYMTRDELKSRGFLLAINSAISPKLKLMCGSKTSAASLPNYY